MPTELETFLLTRLQELKGSIRLKDLLKQMETEIEEVLSGLIRQGLIRLDIDCNLYAVNPNKE
jgi:hypothetical protein